MLTSRSNKPSVLISMGDPSGIGPEVTLKALASPEISGLANFFVIGDGFVLSKLKKDTGLKLKVPLIDLSNVAAKFYSYGKIRASFGKASLEYIDKALGLLKRKKADCLVTAPLNKTSVRMSGISDFEGHTEYLAKWTHSKEVAMMFVGEKLKIVLVTRHIALDEVPKRLSVRAITKTILITHEYLKKFFKIKYPAIGVAGLNPHAGESGIFGNEENKIIVPAIKRVSRHISGVSGPIPPDVIFWQALNKKFDAVIAMYHDQGLIPFKMLYFEKGVNLTLGLPFIRTSPDHGTAFDIAGRNMADPSSMIEAIRLACRLAQKR